MKTKEPETVENITPMGEMELTLGEDIPCECDHGENTPCGDIATWRGTWECMDPGCTNAAESILLCEECKITWEEDNDPLLTFERL